MKEFTDDFLNSSEQQTLLEMSSTDQLIETPLPENEVWSIRNDLKAEKAAKHILHYQPAEVEVFICGKELLDQPSPALIEKMLDNAKEPVSVALYFMDSFHGIQNLSDNEEKLVSVCLEHKRFVSI